MSAVIATRRSYALIVSSLGLTLTTACGSPSTTSSPPSHPVAGSSVAMPVASASGTIPSAGPGVPIDFPEVASTDLSSGVKLVTVNRPRAPLVDVRLVIGSGSAADGEHPGRALVTARIVKDAAKSAVGPAIDPKARTIVVETGVDHTVFRTTLLTDAVESAIAGLGNAVSVPKISALDVRNASHAVSVEESAWLGSLEGVGERLVRRDLFREPIGRHPYATVHPTKDDLAKLDVAAINDCFRGSYVGANMTLVVVGPIEKLDIQAIAERAFAHVSSARPSSITIDDPIARPRPTHIMLVDAKGRSTISITVGRLGPDLGEGETLATRLFAQAVLRRSAKADDGRASFRLVQFREGPSLGLFEANVIPSRAGAMLTALLDHDRAGDMTEKELVDARAALDAELAVSFDRPGFLADSLSSFAWLGLPMSTLEQGSIESATTALTTVSTAGRKLFAGDEVAVVIGDANQLASDLCKVGDVDVLDPARDFERIRTDLQESPAKLPTAPKKGDDSSVIQRPAP